jgi:hypothetical protein
VAFFARAFPLSAAIDASPEPCIWCGVAVERDDGYRLVEPAGERRAAFCRLEHVVPWTMRGARWEAGRTADAAELEPPLWRCAYCGAELPDTRVLLVRHRGEHRVPDAFCSLDHLSAWARAGGRWR